MARKWSLEDDMHLWSVVGDKPRNASGGLSTGWHGDISAMAASAPLVEVVAVVIYRAQPKTHVDLVLLEERLVPVPPCGGVCGTIGFPGGKVERDELPRQALQRELSEELVFVTRGRAPYDVVLSESIGAVQIGMFRITLFVARIPPTVSVTCAAGYRPRVRALHWRRPEAVRRDTDHRVMASTRPLLALVPFPPGGRRAPLAGELATATALPVSGAATVTTRRVWTGKRKRSSTQ
jgi:hypothetical protein